MGSEWAGLGCELDGEDNEKRLHRGGGFEECIGVHQERGWEGIAGRQKKDSLARHLGVTLQGIMGISGETVNTEDAGEVGRRQTHPQRQALEFP